MNHFQVALIARLASDNLIASQEAQTREQAYHGYVQTFMLQGYDIDTAHRMAQDWFAQQNAMQAQIEAGERQQRRKAYLQMALAVLILLALAFVCTWIQGPPA